jgi:hypothetical protein
MKHSGILLIDQSFSTLSRRERAGVRGAGEGIEGLPEPLVRTLS